MSCILLLGAGFSRNWGGWLATEVFDYLFGQVDPGLKELLLKHKRGGGYSFGDDHINRAISAAVAGRNLSIFVMDPLGRDVIDKNRDATIYAPDQLASAIWPHMIGSSIRSLGEIFGPDRVEHGKVMRFFS